MIYCFKLTEFSLQIQWKSINLRISFFRFHLISLRTTSFQTWHSLSNGRHAISRGSYQDLSNDHWLLSILPSISLLLVFSLQIDIWIHPNCHCLHSSSQYHSNLQPVSPHFLHSLILSRCLSSPHLASLSPFPPNRGEPKGAELAGLCISALSIGTPSFSAHSLHIP